MKKNDLNLKLVLHTTFIIICCAVLFYGCKETNLNEISNKATLVDETSSNEIIVKSDIKPEYIRMIDEGNAPENIYKNVYKNVETGELINLDELILGDAYNEDEVFDELCSIVKRKIPNFFEDKVNEEFLRLYFEHRQTNSMNVLNGVDVNLLCDAVGEFYDSETAHKNGRIKVFALSQDGKFCVFKYNDYIRNGSPAYVYDVKNDTISELQSNWILIDFIASKPVFNNNNSIFFLTIYDMDGMRGTDKNPFEKINYRGDFVYLMRLDRQETRQLSYDIHAEGDIYLTSNEQFAYFKVYKSENKWAFCGIDKYSSVALEGKIVKFIQNDSIVVMEKNNEYFAYSLSNGEEVTSKITSGEINLNNNEKYIFEHREKNVIRIPLFSDEQEQVIAQSDGFISNNNGEYICTYNINADKMECINTSTLESTDIQMEKEIIAEITEVPSVTFEFITSDDGTKTIRFYVPNI